MERYDFSGWATRNNIRCSDGRTILRDAFKHDDGVVVPLVWNHQHNDPSNVLGQALLENRRDGVYTYCTFNDTEAGQNAKALVQHGDVTALSIHANQLKQQGGNVHHGAIREVSLVLAGANPGAFIDNILSHSGFSDEEAIIYSGEEGLTLYHNKKEDIMANRRTVRDVLDTLDEEQEEVVYMLLGQALEHSGMDEEDEYEDEEYYDDEDYEDDEEEYYDEEDDEDEEYYDEDEVDYEDDEEEYYDDEEDEEYYDEDDEDYEDGGYEEMKHNVFENENDYYEGGELTHSEINNIFDDAKRNGSLKDSVLMHADDYGIEQIDWLFPEAKNLNTPPEFIKRDMGWVATVMAGVHHTPFSRIKSMFADITEDEARAKGYIKGNKKKEEVFGLLKRQTSPTTIYKKQKLDRDDVVDITDFDVVAWLKGEMRMMLDEEIARAILVSDNRSPIAEDKIKEDCIRPIWKEDTDLFAVPAIVPVTGSTTEEEKVKAFIKQSIKARKNYKGSGNPTLFTTEDMLTECLLLEDKIGHRLYKTEAELATALRVSRIVTVPVMENLKRDVTVDDVTKHRTLLGIIVNLKDYNVGADKGGAVNMFDDFDIDFNQQKYLIETRCSGALVKPFSAIIIEAEDAQ